MVIAISIHKGGTGKTTTALNLAAALREQGKKVLLIDLDSQCNLTSTLGLSEDSEKNVARWLLEQYSFKDVVQHRLGMDIIPAAYELVSREADILSEAGAETLLRGQLKALRKQYDYIILDCPPSLGIMTANALVAADQYVIPMLAATYSYIALDKMLKTVEKIKRRMNENLELAGVLFTQHSQNARTVLGKGIVDATKDQVKVFHTAIRTNKALDEAVHAKQDIFTYNKETSGAADYMQFSKELLSL